mmetsp:Transcript_14218/g.30377  ORF Transcript_14218/g.30377 Transcript_14218/m.30377 type:complete len:1807 (+) Transcript_14218:1506-6926(+)
MHGVSCAHNLALDGGGGALFWAGNIPPKFISWCREGHYPDDSSTCTPRQCALRCLPCSAGKYQTAQGSTNSSACLHCSPGTYSSMHGAAACTGCGKGNFSAPVGATSWEVCAQCSAGTYTSFDSASVCSDCMAGFFTTALGSSVCQKCDAGTFASESEATVCATCVSGSYVSEKGATICIVCNAGAFSTSSSSCTSCSAGTFSTLAGATGAYACTACAAGTYSEVNGAAGCASCAAGTFNPLTSAASALWCTSCREGTISLPRSSACINATVSKKGRPLDLHDISGSVVVDLPFNFSIFCSEYNQTTASSNGILQFGYTLLTGTNPWPIYFESDFIDSYIAIFWMMMTSGDQSTFLEWRSADKLTLQWTNWFAVALSADGTAVEPVLTSSLTFQASLHSNNTIELCYPALAGPYADGNMASIGIRGGAFWSSVSELNPAPVNNKCLLFSPVPEQCNILNVTTYPSPSDATLVPLCPPGKYLAANAACSSCISGKYQTGYGATSESSCVECPAGTFSIARGAIGLESCTLCKGNLTSDDSDPGCLDGSAVGFTPGQLTKPDLVLEQQHRGDVGITSDCSIWQFNPISDLGNPGLREEPVLAFQDSTVHLRNNSSINGHDLCGTGNSALFGQCLASSGRSLRIYNIPESDYPAYAGLPFQLSVAKEDAYNQTVESDSISFLQLQVAIPRTDGGLQPHQEVVVSGDAVFKLQSGKARIEIAVRPEFSVVDPQNGLALLSRQVFFSASGQDLESSQPLSSTAVLAFFAAGKTVCPQGYVLTLDTLTESVGRSESNAKAAGAGRCVYCQVGTYSIIPLGVGSAANGTKPICLNCPPVSTCTGGSNVTLGLGYWVKSDPKSGMFVLESCPAGHQLINSIGGSFNHDVQRCEPCGPGKYILQSLDPKAACQLCPAGAFCDGDRLHPAVNNSAWVADAVKGQCVLLACPAGYELINAATDGGQFSYALQQCNLCPASSFCPGGAGLSQHCPPGTFAPAGSSSPDSCKPAAFLVMSVVLSLAPDAFQANKRAAFRDAVAYTIGAATPSVIVDSVVSATARQMRPAETLITARVAASDSSAAAAFKSDLRVQVLNLRLQDQGLPPATLISADVVSSLTGEVPQYLSLWPAVGGAIGGFALVVAVAVFVLWRMMQKYENEEEKLLQITMATLRSRLGIELRDGYALNTEPAGRCIVLQRGYLEAAARLDLLQDFDVHQLDAFCLCLECGRIPLAHSSGAGSMNTTRPRNKSPYDKACDWILEVSTGLIKPGAPILNKTTSSKRPSICLIGKDELLSKLRVEERFPYFITKVCKLRIWSDNDGALFERLKDVARSLLAEIAHHCEKRFSALKTEPGGAALLSFRSLCDPPSNDGLVGARRQDHPEVRAIVVHEEARCEANLELEGNAGVSEFPDEEVFISQLHRRAKILNEDFQATVWNIIAAHATSTELEQNNTSPATDAISEGRVRTVWSVLQGAVGRTLSSVSGNSFSPFPTLHQTLSSSEAEGLKRTESTHDKVTAASTQGTSTPFTSVRAHQVCQLMQSSDLVFPDPSSGMHQPLFRTYSGQALLADGVCGNIEVSVNSNWSNLPPGDVPGWSMLTYPGPYLYFDHIQPYDCQCPGPSISDSSSDFPEQKVALSNRPPIRVASEQEFRSSSASGLSSGQSRSAEAVCRFSDGPDQVWVFAGPVKSAARMREKLGEYALEGAAWPLCAQILDPVRASVVCSGPAQIIEVASWFVSEQNVGGGPLTVCRVKNKFSLANADLVGGYRDLMVCGILEGSGGLRIIGEIQIHDKQLHDLKLLMHKLYRIQRANAANAI